MIFSELWMSEHPYVKDGKKVFLNMAFNKKKETAIIWLLFYGAKNHSKNIECKIQIGNLTDGLHSYQGPVASLDDNKTTIFESQRGLNIPFKIVKEFLQNDELRIEFEVEFKSNNNGQKLTNENKSEQAKIMIENN